MGKQIEHEGTITSICDDTMIVRIAASSACAGCAAKGHCMPVGNKDLDICIEKYTGSFEAGEQVKIIMQQSIGMQAVFIGYIVPFAVALTTLIAVYQLTKNELASGLSSLFVLVPYYLILKLINKKITKTFGFTVKKR